eukprot:CAMPEP_0168472898 /NCGR_PEP_ID=MMETSP0228-20121227/60039_1 /TAXON_ID=133427 /ORGANISM="Protoceratium reticulatum, Strain CCCM 535 (=CCMP 1889)" /LENGTH=38 /DNA_ID= /DNA_START= /DNA_END= /DNA_ORIENTATION=
MGVCASKGTETPAAEEIKATEEDVEVLEVGQGPPGPRV